MAHAQSLIQWLLLNAGTLKLQIDYLNWVDDAFPGFTDIRVQITIGGLTHTGFGSAASQDLALTKAAAEALERAVLRDNKFSTSNGLAAHMSANLAMASAINELLERDSILCHFYGNQPYKRLPMDAVRSPFFNSLRSWYELRDISFSLFELGAKGALFVVDGRHRSTDAFGFILGGGHKSTREESVESAAFEATRQLAHLLERASMPAKSLNEFLEIPAPSFRDHGDLALDLDYARRIEYLFDGVPRSKFKQLNESHVRAELVTSNSPELEGCPLFFARAVSAEAQDMFLGAPNPRRINLARIGDFLGAEISYAQVCPLPHPFA